MRKTALGARTGMAITLDYGRRNRGASDGIKTNSPRLSRLALHDVYDKSIPIWSVRSSARPKRDGDKMVLTFDHGPDSRRRRTSFRLRYRSSDQKFVWAKAED